MFTLVHTHVLQACSEINPSSTFDTLAVSAFSTLVSKLYQRHTLFENIMLHCLHIGIYTTCRVQTYNQKFVCIYYSSRCLHTYVCRSRLFAMKVYKLIMTVLEHSSGRSVGASLVVLRLILVMVGNTALKIESLRLKVFPDMVYDS